MAQQDACMEIDRSSAVPPYRQIAAILREQIQRGEYRPGQRLPGIIDLMQVYGVARLTARKALKVLIDEHIAQMSPGLGTYVTEPPVSSSPNDQ